LKRVLFIDDEPRVLDGLRRMLRSMRDEVVCEFYDSGEKALDALAQSPADIVVTDMKMPGMDGAALLGEVQKRFPGTIRIVLSGHSEPKAFHRAMGAAHRYLTKPSDADALKSVIRRSLSLRDLLTDDRVAASVGSVESLPSLPTLYHEVMAEANEPNASLARIAAVIAKDVGMSAKLLTVANSAYFGLSKPVHNVERAVMYLGQDTVVGLLLNAHIFSRYEGRTLNGESLESLMAHCCETASLARGIARHEGLDLQELEASFAAGMLHDVGKLLFLSKYGEGYAEVLGRARAMGTNAYQLEREVLGATHAAAGAYLIGLWGLPESVVEAIAYHEEPGQAHCRGFSHVTAVHVADRISRHGEVPDEAAAAGVDLEHLQARGLVDHWPAWRDLAAKIMTTAARE
jgi:HD-like signal output (HDOD) protein/CheY-like chemotaxis protein